jgi:hypothetical protein
VPGEGFEPPTNGLQNRCSTTELTRHCGTFSTLARELAPDWHRALFSFRLQAVEQTAHDFGGLCVLTFDRVAVNPQRDAG